MTPPGRIILAACVGVAAMLVSRPAALAQEPVISPGFTVGDTIGIDWNFVDPERPRNSYEAAAGWTIRGENAYEFRWMYRRTVHEFRAAENTLVQLYIGAGFRVKLEDDLRYGLRAPVGVVILLSREDLSPEIFVEAAPTYDLAPEHGSSVGAAAGVRWRFQ
jgi:hypothetical protein